MSIILKHNQMLTNNGVFVLPRTMRIKAGTTIRPGVSVKVFLNGIDLGDKVLDGDYRVRVGQKLVDLVSKNSIVTVSLVGTTVEVLVVNNVE